MTVQNNFSGGLVTVDGANQNSPYNSSWSLYTSHSFSAISPQTIGSANYVWCAWNDGGGQSRNVTVGEYSSSLSYTANFLGTYISGPDWLRKGESYTYDSNPSGGSGNRSYQWYKRWEGGSQWDPLGTSQTQRVTMHSMSFTLKVDVTDNAYGKTATATKYVQYDDGSFSRSTPGDLSNHPNPFNPSTVITFSLPQWSFVRLRVFDLLGRVVAVLLEEQRPAGRHSARFDASSLPSGVYLYRLEAGSHTEAKKMLLLK